MNDPNNEEIEDLLGHVDYRRVVEIVQELYPRMDAKEVFRLVLHHLRLSALGGPLPDKTDDAGSD